MEIPVYTKEGVMKSLRTVVFVAAVCALLILPAAVYALDKGTARLISVTRVAGGCVAGPTGATVQAWDVEPGHIYAITISNVTECASGGTDPTLNVRVNSSIPGYEYTDVVAAYVSPGVYQFNYFMPPNAWCTLPILYCTTPGEWLTTGLFVIRNDGGTNSHGVPYAAHLRASRFESVGEGCTNPTPILGPECGGVGTEDGSWGAIKELFR